MGDTYARVMRVTDGPGDRRTTRSRAPRRSGVLQASGGTTPSSHPAAGIPAVTAMADDLNSAAGALPAPGGTTRPDIGQAGQAEVAASPAEMTFAAAVAAFMAGRDAQLRRGLVFEDVPAPKRLAPYATAIAATVQRDDDDVASGRLVLLYDPDGQQGWGGFFRLVAYVRADVEPEMAADPLLGEVGWSWLAEALDARVPGYAVPSGTVTRVITEGFGAKRDEVPLTGFELRASWSPVGPSTPGGVQDSGTGDLDILDLSAHIAAWCDCLCAAAGLEPPGTRALRQPVQRQPGHG
jgi:hypothetical protein